MAINIKFDLAGNPEPPTIILANRNGNKLGQLDVDFKSIDLKDALKLSEFTFTLHKYVDGELTNLWDKVVDFKLVYCKEWDTWFEIKVELDEATETVKTVFCTQLGQAELSQVMLYNIEINTEEDIARDDYKISILYDENDPKASILDRILSKAPHYSIAHVDETLKRIQRSFSFDDNSVCDALDDIEEEIGCLVVYNSNSIENGMPNRAISVYDLQQNCNDCGYRGEFTDICPKCNSTNITNGYGEDTLIFVTSDELATEGIQLVTDTDSVKNCFKLEAGDDLMTATIRNCNPNGTDYIWYFSDNVKEDMSEELVKKIEDYDNEYKNYYNNNVSNINESLLNSYNSLVEKYKGFYNTHSTCLNCDYEGVFDAECPQCGSGNILTGKSLQTISTPIIGYSALMNAYYNTIDLTLYLKSGLMPSVEMSDTSAEEQVKLLTASSLSPVAVANIDTISLATANSAVLAMAKIIVKSIFKVQVNSSELSADKKTWTGNFVVTNYSDEEDTAISETISVEINGDNETFIKQKIEKALNKENTDDYSISGLFKKEYDDFCNELKKYALNPLISFRDACQACIDILMEQGIGDDVTSDLYKNLYTPYYNKLIAIETEIKIREDEINLIVGVYDNEDNLISEGLQTDIERCKVQIQNALNFENYLGKELWLEFCSYRRESKYSNENYISDGLNNAELFKNALEFIEVAENEIYKSSELQHSISTTLNNLLAIPKFKSLIKSFKTGNWIRVQVDDKVYKLRLLEYDISYGDFENIPVEFSDINRIKNGTTDVQDIFSQASSMASSYDSVQRQAKKGNVARSTIDQWMTDGLDAANIQIQSNNNEEVVITKNGLVARSYSDITGAYSPEQLKITHNIMAYTDDDWKTVKQAIGKHNYKFYNKEEGSFVEETGYGMTAEFVTAGYVSGSQIIGGDIYSVNYSSVKDEEAGSYLNLSDGTFSFAGGKLTYDGDHLSVDGEITVATSGTIGCWNVNNNSIYKGSEIFGNTDGMYFGTEGLSLGDTFKVTSDGVATMTDANVTGVINAKEGGTIAGWKIGSETLSKQDDDNGFAVHIRCPETKEINTSKSDVLVVGERDATNTWNYPFVLKSDGSLKCTKVDISGEVNATSGSFTNCTIDDTCTISGELSGATGTFSGTVSASTIEGTTISGSTIEGATIKGSTIEGGSISIGDENGYYAWISEEGVLNAEGANISGTINAVNGNIAGWDIASDALYKNIYGVSSGMCSTTQKSVSEGLEYTLSDDGEYYIVSGIGTCIDADVVIPDTYESKPVTTIGDYAFMSCLTLFSVTMPNSITSIGIASFYDCALLANIVMQNAITTIGNGAFSHCKSLTSVIIPDGTTSIGDSAFEHCTLLKSVIIPESVISIGTNAFYNCSDNAEFYCKVESQPSGWNDNWTDSESIIWGYSDNYNSLVAKGTTSQPRFFAGSNSYIPKSINDAKFLVLEDGSLYANAANIKGYIEAENGSFKGYIEANSGKLGNLHIYSNSISSDDNELVFNNDGTIIAKYFEAENIKASQISGRTEGSPSLSFETTSNEKEEVKATVTSVITESGEQSLTDITKEGVVTVTVKTDKILTAAKTFVITASYYSDVWQGFNRVDYKATIPSGTDNVSITVPHMRWMYTNSTTSFVTSRFEYSGSYLNYSSFWQISKEKTENIVCSANFVPDKESLTLGSSTMPWNSIYSQKSVLQTTAWSSDRKLKDNIENINYDFSEQLIKGLLPKSYVFKTAQTETHYGFVAQEVEELLNNLGINANEVGIVNKSMPDKPDEENNYYSLNYIDLIAPMVSVIQRLLKRVTELEENLKS